MSGLAATVRAAAKPLVPGPAAGVEAGDLLLVYTSGTTGEPKGAMHTRAGMLANAQAAIEAQGFGADTRVLSVLPLFHVGGLCIQTLPALAAGGQVRLQPRFDAGAWFDEVAAWRPTTSLLVPAVMRALIEHPRWAAADLSSLGFVNSGSQIVPRYLDRGLPRPRRAGGAGLRGDRDRAGVDRAAARRGDGPSGPRRPAGPRRASAAGCRRRDPAQGAAAHARLPPQRRALVRRRGLVPHRRSREAACRGALRGRRPRPAS